MKLYETLENQLKKENNFVTDEGELKKWVVIGKARNYDPVLIKLLLGNDTLKEKFFVEVKETLVFKQEEFITFMEMKNYLNDSYTQYKNKVGLTIDGKYLKQRNEVALVWPYKDCVLEGGQTKEEQKREEIFFNEILAQDEITQLFEPKVLTNAKVYDKDGEHKFTGFTRDAELNRKRGLPEDTITDNLIIKGNNLLALHSLKKEFAGKVKLIYIDPPYNTGGASDSFTYNNNFKHSTWLTFIKNRLNIAKDLLSNDGFIAITIDHVELFYLGTLADEIFGKENRVGIVTIYINPKGRQHERFFSASTEYMLVYTKNINKAEFNKVTIDENKSKKFNLIDKKGRYRLDKFTRIRSNTTRKEKPNFFYPIYVKEDLSEISAEEKDGFIEVYPIEKGIEYTWKTKKDTFKKRLEDNQYVAKKEGGKIIICNKFYEQQVFKNLWTDKKYFPEFQGTNLLKKILGKNVFSYPKSLYAVIDTIKIMVGKDDIVLDFFAGSGTTGHAVLELNKKDGGNRQFILIEQLDEHINICIERNQKVIKQENIEANFTYLELKKYNETFIEKIQEAKTTNELLEIWEQMKERSFLNYNVDIKKQEEHIEEFKQLSIEEQKQHLIEILDKNQLYVNLTSMNDKDFEVSQKEKQVTKDFYQIKKD